METQSHIHQYGTYMERVTLAIALRQWNQPLRSTFRGKLQVITKNGKRDIFNELQSNY